ncbi:Fur-regulated basic protein FbpA [Bacillus lacus]|uniref:Fur-regulated basic protein FbpA n=1 Tax=Metabacillus lacus TaxID=1983721 RepID=A0A7X2IYG4_9BACI|nr:Fur-regulated basic protein FbpA [Metabacillus lacus]
MKKWLLTALEEQRDYYSKQLLAIGVYNQSVLKNMTITELKSEYHYFYHCIPEVKRKKTQ